ncbi:hypothetical protein HispidOSU_012197 [Sigmodon hispidus]
MAGLVVSGTQVSYVGQDCREIPEQLGRDCGHFAKRLDLSFNLLSLCLTLLVMNGDQFGDFSTAIPRSPRQAQKQGFQKKNPGIRCLLCLGCAAWLKPKNVFVGFGGMERGVMDKLKAYCLLPSKELCGSAPAH